LFPGTSTFKSNVTNNLINNGDITVNDINRVFLVYGTSIPLIEGEITRHRPPVHTNLVRVPLPLIIAAHHLGISFLMDFSKSTAKFSSTQSQTK